MSNWNNEVVLQKCPGCGKEEGAFMGSSRWGHNVMCCSNECGMKIKRQFDINMLSDEYHQAVVDYRKAKNHMWKIKHQGIII